MKPTKIRVFRGKLNGKYLEDYISQIDYELHSLQDRINCVNKILEEDSYYVEYFDKYFVYSPNCNQHLSENDNVCRSLEKMADYLLFSEEEKQRQKENKTEYKIFKSAKMFKLATREMGAGDINELEINKPMCMLIEGNKNYYLENKQNIFESDFKDREIGDILIDYRNLKNQCSEKIGYNKILISLYKNQLSNPTIDNDYAKEISQQLTELRRYNNKLRMQVSLLKDDMLQSKHGIKKPIEFKHISPCSTEIDWYLFNFSDINQVLALLQCPSKPLNTDLGVLVYDLEQLMSKIKFNDTQKKVLDLWRNQSMTQEVIAEVLHTAQQNISLTLRSIARMIVKQYLEEWEDYIYLNWVKGDYKKCSQCGIIKLISKFGKHPDTNDNLYPSCKDCRKNNR